MSSCIFCQIIAGKLPASVVHEDEHVIAFMDIFPMRPGHVLVVPKTHAQYVPELDSETRSHLMETGSRISTALRQSSLRPDALHFAINDGVAAHQTVPHVHLHLLPRYQGDTLRFAGTAIGKPLQLLLGPKKRELLDKQARELRELLETV